MNTPIWEVIDSDNAVEGLREDGTPDPNYPASLGIVQATIGRRVQASAIDFSGWFLLQIPALFMAWPLLWKLLRGRITWYGFTQHPDHTKTLVVLGVTFGLTLVYCLANVFFNGSRGVTLGKAMIGLRTVNVVTLGKPGFGRALLRGLVIWVPAIVVIGPILVLMSPAWDTSARNRGWADKVAGTWLVDIKAGLNPYDEKRMRIARKMHVVEPVPVRDELPALTTAETAPSYRPGSRVSAGVLGSTASADLRGSPAPQRARTPLIPPSYQPPAQPARPRPARAAQPAQPAATAWSVPPAQPAQPAAPEQSAASAWSTPAAQPAPLQPAPRRVAESPLVLVLDTGERIEVSQAILLGRGPVVTEATAGATPVAIADTTFSVSKTHVMVRRAGDAVEVVDLGSTNGTFVVRAGVEQALAAGQSAAAAVGDTIRFGDRTVLVQHRVEERA